jgi:hypothetical protein
VAFSHHSLSTLNGFLIFAMAAANVKLHGARPWHLQSGKLSGVATGVKLHGARPWHLKIVNALSPLESVCRDFPQQSDSQVGDI